MKKENFQIPSNYYGLYIPDNYVDIYLVNKDDCDKLISTMKTYSIDCLDKYLFTIITDEEFYQKLLSLGVKPSSNSTIISNSDLDVKFLSLIITKYIIKNKSKILSLIHEIDNQWSV
jgi:hypothetical protein